MRFFSDSDLTIPVTWFFCAPGALVFPEHHLFGSGNWASDRFDWDGPGEVLGEPRPYSKGKLIPGLIGDHFCGPVKGYTEGTVFPGVPLNTHEDGQCRCCASCFNWPDTPILYFNLEKVTSNVVPPYGTEHTSYKLFVNPALHQWFGFDPVASDDVGDEVIPRLTCAADEWLMGFSHTTPSFFRLTSQPVAPAWNLRWEDFLFSAHEANLAPGTIETWTFSVTDVPLYP